VTHYVALPFVASDDGIAAGEPTECLDPSAAAMRAEALSRHANPSFRRDYCYHRCFGGILSSVGKIIQGRGICRLLLRQSRLQ
jgi:hypothetical protein